MLSFSECSATAEGRRRPLTPAAALLELDGHGVLHPRRGVAGRAGLAQRVPGGVQELIAAAAWLAGRPGPGGPPACRRWPAGPGRRPAGRTACAPAGRTRCSMSAP